MRPLLPLIALLSGCTPTLMTTKYDLHGWFSVQLGGGIESYSDRVQPIPLSLSAPRCEDVQSLVTHHRVFVLVPGLVGDNAEWKDVVKVLAPDGSAFLLRYLFSDERDDVTARLAAGVTRLLRCLPDEDQVVVVGHSAGGILASLASAGFANAESKRGPRVLVVTVAAELAGTLKRPGPVDGQQQRMFALDIGTAIDAYPPPAPGVQVVHLVTQAPNDPHMGENDGHLPNDPRVHVPGAHEVVLEGQGHADSLIYAAAQLAGGGWKKWLEASVAK